MDVSPSLLKNITYNQQLIVNALAKKQDGMLSRELTHKTGISNKSDIVNRKLITALAQEGLEIRVERASNSKQWLWTLRKIEN